MTTPVPADGPDAKGASYAAPHDRQQAVRGLPDVHKGTGELESHRHPFLSSKLVSLRRPLLSFLTAQRLSYSAGRSIQALCNCGDGSLLSGGDDKCAKSRVCDTLGGSALFGVDKRDLFGSTRREVALTDWVDGRELYRWKGHTGTVNRLAFSPASRLAFSGARCASAADCAILGKRIGA